MMYDVLVMVVKLPVQETMGKPTLTQHWVHVVWKQIRAVYRQRGVEDSDEVSLMAELSLLMLTKLIALQPVFCLCFPGGPFQWCAAVSNSAQAKSTPPKSSTPKSSRPEVRESEKRRWLIDSALLYGGFTFKDFKMTKLTWINKNLHVFRDLWNSIKPTAPTLALCTNHKQSQRKSL